MRFPLFLMSCIGLIGLMVTAVAAPPQFPAVNDAMQRMIANHEIAGAVTMVLSPDAVLHLGTHGHADVADERPMTAETVFWIASMSKPVTAAAVLMLQDEGKLRVTDPVSKYIPEFADLRTPTGEPANLTLVHLLTHTSGLIEATGEAARQARELSDLVPLWVAKPVQFQPGSTWRYCQSGINAAGRVVEIVSGQRFDAFLRNRLFEPLGMKDTTFYPEPNQLSRMATGYAKSAETGLLQAVPRRPDFGSPDRPPLGNGGLFSTPNDYGLFCRMLLQGGSLDGKRYLSEDAMTFLSKPRTGDIPTGFFQSEVHGYHGGHYGWGLGTCVLLEPHDGVASMLSPGTFGHGGAWGTQAWIDPVRRVAMLLMVQRSNFPNSDASEVRREFQSAAVESLKP